MNMFIMVLVPLLQMFFLAVDTDAYLIKTEDGATQVFTLPDEQAVRLLFWVQEPDTQLSLTYSVMSFEYSTLNLTISKTEEWISAHFYYDRVYIPAAGVEKYPTPPSWWGRRVRVSSQEPTYWHLCRSSYECSPGPPPWGTHLAVGTSTAKSSRGPSPTVVILGVVCGVLFLTILALCVYICYVRRTNTLRDAHSQGQEVVQEPTHSSSRQVPQGVALATVLHTAEAGCSQVRH